MHRRHYSFPKALVSVSSCHGPRPYALLRDLNAPQRGIELCCMEWCNTIELVSPSHNIS